MMVRFSPDGKTASTIGLQGTARLWDAATGQPIGLPLEHPSDITAAVFPPDGKTLLTIDTRLTVRRWDPVTAQLLGQPIQLGGGACLGPPSGGLSPDGTKALAILKDRGVGVWELPSGKFAGPLLGYRWASLYCDFTPDGRTALLIGKDGARLWDLSTRTSRTWPILHQDLVGLLAFAPDGRSFVTGGSDDTAQLWNVATGRPQGQAMHHPAHVTRLTYNPDSKRLATVCEDNKVRVWEVQRACPAERRCPTQP
jgi:WD40 repeat protein